MKRCVFCGRHRITGRSISHSHKSVKRVFYPNLQYKKIFFNGKYEKQWVCTDCLKKGKDLEGIKIKEHQIKELLS